MSKLVKRILCIILIVLCAIEVILITNQVRANDSDIIKPVAAESAEDNHKNVSLRNKSIIGFGKYGFRQKITIENPTIVIQYVVEDYDLKDVRYGIYEDKALTVPIKELQFHNILKILDE